MNAIMDLEEFFDEDSIEGIFNEIELDEQHFCF